MRNFLPERRGRPRHSAVVLGRCFISGREGRRARRAEGRRARPFARGSAGFLREALLGIRVLPRTGAGAAGGALPATRVARCGRSGVLGRVCSRLVAAKLPFWRPRVTLTRRVYELPRHGGRRISRAMYPLLQAVNGGGGAQKNSYTQRIDGARRGGREGRGAREVGVLGRACSRPSLPRRTSGFWVTSLCHTCETRADEPQNPSLRGFLRGIRRICCARFFST